MKKKNCELILGFVLSLRTPPMQLLLPRINSTIKNHMNKKQVFPDLGRRPSGESPQFRRSIKMLKILK